MTSKEILQGLESLDRYGQLKEKLDSIRWEKEKLIESIKRAEAFKDVLFSSDTIELLTTEEKDCCLSSIARLSECLERLEVVENMLIEEMTNKSEDKPVRRLALLT